MFLSQPSTISSAILVFALVFAGCGDVSQKSKTSSNSTSNNSANNSTNNASSNNANNTTFEIVSGEVTTLAAVAQEVSTVGGTRAQAGNMLVLVDVKIGNGLEESLAVGYDKFRLKTGDNLERSASALSAATMPACPIDVLQSAGTVLTCQIAFEFPMGIVLTTLIFETPTGTVESALTFEACTACDGRCVDLKTDTSHCGACFQGVPNGGECVDGAPGCPAGSYSCHGYCEDNSYGCNIDADIRKDCSSVCGEAGLTCDRANYFYTCGEDGISDRDADCGAVPPTGCADYYVNCECGP